MASVEKLIKRKKVTELDQLIKDNIGKEPSSSRRREDLRKVGVESTENLNKVDIRLEDLTYPGKVSVKKRSSSSSASQSIKFESAKSADHSNSTGKDAETFNLPDLLIDNNESKREPNNEIIENLKQFNIDFKIKFEKEFKIEITNSNDLNTTEFLTKTNAKTNDLLIAEHITNSANIISKTTLGSNDLKTIDTPQKPLKRQIKRVLKTIGNNDDSEEGNEGEDTSTSLTINSLSLPFFCSQLVTHFSILYERNQIVWPKSKRR